MNVEFKKAGIEDVKILGIMNKRLIEDEGHSNPMNTDELTERMRNFISNEYTAYLIVIENGIAGYCLFRDDKEYIYIRQLYVEENKRKMGLGKACIQWLKSNLWINRKIRMDVLNKNKNGIEFWRKIGFQNYAITMEM